MRAQISLDAIFAFTLITLTVLSLVNLSAQEVGGVKSLDTAAQLKVFAISLRDAVVQVYSTEGNVSLRKELPFNLSSGEWVNVTLNSTGTLWVVARIRGKTYVTMERVPVFIGSSTEVSLGPGSDVLWVVGRYNDTTGVTDVRLSKTP